MMSDDNIVVHDTFSGPLASYYRDLAVKSYVIKKKFDSLKGPFRFLDVEEETTSEQVMEGNTP